MRTEGFRGALPATLMIVALMAPAIATISLLSAGPVSTEGAINKFTNSSFENWPMFRHDLRHTGYTTSLGPTDNHVIWTTYQTGSHVDSSPSVVDGKVYIASKNGVVYCLNADNGDEIWTYTAGYSVNSSPAVAGGKVYIGSHDGNVYCLNADNGDMIWTYQTGSTVNSSPAVAGGKVYISSYNSKVYCLNADNGDMIWAYQTAYGWVSSSPAVAGGKVYIGCQSYGYNVYCLNADNGDEIWTYQTGDFVSSSPSVVDGKVYIGSKDSKVYCLNADNGDVIWTYQTRGSVRSSPAVAGGKVYIGSHDDNVYCLNADNGDMIWTYTTGDWVYSSPAVADGKVYIGSFDRKVYCLNADNGDEIWTYQTGDFVSSSPSVVDGKVYIGSRDRKVYCFGPLEWGVQVSIAPSENVALPGEDACFTVTIKNLGINDDNYTLENSDNQGWPLGLENDVLEIPAGENRTTTLDVIIPENVTGCTQDNITVIATSQADNTVSDNGSCIAHAQVVRGIEVLIEPESQFGVIGRNVVFTVTAKNTGNVWDNYDLTPSDDAGWILELDNDYLEIPKNENRETKLTVSIPDNENLVCTTDNITVVATAIDNVEVTDNDNATVHAVSPWTGTAVFSLLNLYTVNVEKILDFNVGSKLVVKFYKYDNVTFESENIIESFIPPAHVEENENARHPEGIGVKKARLDLTTDNTEDVISTIATFTVTRDILAGRLVKIYLEWPFASLQERDVLNSEIVDIYLQWPFAPF